MLKRGLQTFDILTVIVQIIFLVIVSFSIVYLVLSGLGKGLDVGPLRAASFNDRIYFSLVHEDLVTGYETKKIPSFPGATEEQYTEIKNEVSNIRKYPGILDISKFDEDSIEKIYSFDGDNKFLAAKITLLDIDSRIIKEVYYNKERFDRWRPLSWTPFYSEYTYSYPVLVSGHSKVYGDLIKKIGSELDGLKGSSQTVILNISKNQDSVQLIKTLDLSELNAKSISFNILDFDGKNPSNIFLDAVPINKLKIGLYDKDGKEYCKSSEYQTNANSLLTFDRYLTTCENSFTYHNCNVGSNEVLITYCGMSSLSLPPFSSPQFNVYVSNVNEVINKLSLDIIDFDERSKKEFDSLQMKVEVIVPS